MWNPFDPSRRSAQLVNRVGWHEFPRPVLAEMRLRVAGAGMQAPELRGLPASVPDLPLLSPHR